MDKAHTDPASVAVEQRLSDFYGLAASIVDCHSVMRAAYATTEWDCLDDDGKQWITAIVREAISRAAPSPAPEAVEGAKSRVDLAIQCCIGTIRNLERGGNLAGLPGVVAIAQVLDDVLAALKSTGSVSGEAPAHTARERVARLLGADPLCNGRVTTETIDAIAALQPDRDALVEALTSAWSDFKVGFLSGRAAWPSASIDAMQRLNKLLPGSCVALNRAGGA